MKMSRRRFLSISAASLASPAFAGLPHSWQGTVMGADATISLTGDRAQVRPVLDQAKALLEHIENLFSLYRRDSALSQLNRVGHLRGPDRHMLDLMRICGWVNHLTHGRFDPSIQPLWQAFVQGQNTDAARRLVGWDKVRISPDMLKLGQGQALTLNGIAQGYATDLVAQLLRDHGFGRALVNIGEYQAIGGPFTLGIEDPHYGLVGQRSLRNGAIATSSPGALMLGQQPHIMGGTVHWSTISVEAESAALADGLSTALCLADLPSLRRIAAQAPGLRRVIAVDPQGNLRTILPKLS